MAKPKASLRKKVNSKGEHKVGLPESAKKHLLAVALKLFADKGFDGVSTREIANQAELNISLISYYFGGKEGLYHAILMGMAHEFDALLQSRLQNIDLKKIERSQFENFISIIIFDVIERKVQNPEFIKLLIREHLDGLPNIKAIHEDFFDQLGERVVSVFEAGVRRGFLLKSVNPYVFFMLVVQTVDLYYLSQSCKTKFIKKAIHLDTEVGRKLFADQVKGLFLHGVLV